MRYPTVWKTYYYYAVVLLLFDTMVSLPRMSDTNYSACQVNLKAEDTKIIAGYHVCTGSPCKWINIFLE